MKLYQGKKWNIEFLPRLGSLWIGCHYSKRYESYCIALIRCFVIRIGKTQYVRDPDIWEKYHEDSDTNRVVLDNDSRAG